MRTSSFNIGIGPIGELGVVGSRESVTSENCLTSDGRNWNRVWKRWPYQLER